MRRRLAEFKSTHCSSQCCVIAASLLFGLWFGIPAVAAPALIKEARVSASGETTRLVLDVSQAVSEHVFTLDHPDRVVIDIADARLGFSEAAWPTAQGSIKEFRAADRGNGMLRVVVEVTAPVSAHSFAIEPNEGYGHRLVVDLMSSPSKAAGVSSSSTNTPARNVAPPAVVKSLPKSGRDIIVAIDAGHGGEDPGAIGRKGTREKDVTLAIARKLKERIDAEPGMRAVLTRDSDYFVPLRERMVRARKQKADLFISVHADSVRDRDVSGSSVYVLSAGRASNEAARMLADRENAADLMGGVSLEDKDEVLASVLLDLSQGASMSASVEAADKVLRQLERVSEVLDSEVKHASLKVLTSPEMPSMLIETAFISNPREEAKLKDARHQSRLAEAVTAGVHAYFYENPLPGTRVAQLKAQDAPRSDGGVGSLTTIAAGNVAP